MKQKIIFLLAIFSISLLAFEAQEAFAAQPALGNAFTVSTTTIRVCFDAADVDPATTANADFQVNFGAGFVAGITNTVDEANEALCGGANDSVLLTVAEFATSATPTIRVLANSVADTPGGTTGPAANADVVAADRVAPTFDSADTATVNSITATFSENVADAETADFTITNPSVSVLSVSINGAVVTINTVEAFGEDATPNVALGGDGIQDTVDTSNVINTGNKDATDGITNEQRSSGGSDNSAPSIGGIDGGGFSGVTTIDNGFSYNFNPTDVTGWKTDYPLIRTPVGAMNTLDVKVFENKGLTNIYFVSVNLGAPSVGKAGEAIVTYYPNQAEKIKIIDPNNLLGEVDFKVDSVKCKADSTSESCFKFSLEHSFNDTPIHDVVGIAIADMSRNVAYAYFNHGVEVYGDSLNPPVTETITNTYEKYSPQIILTQTDRELDLWTDENENQWTRNNMGSWIKLTEETYIVPDDNTISPNGVKRINQHFAKYQSEQESISKQIWDSTQIQSVNSNVLESTQFNTNDSNLEIFVSSEIENAKLIWDSNTIQNDIPDYFAYDYPIEILRNDNAELNNALDLEAMKAYDFFNEYYKTNMNNELDDSPIIPERMFEGTRNGALHVDYSKLQESKSVEFDKANELLYKLYGKW